MNGRPSARHLTLAVAFAALVTLPFWMPGIYYVNVSSQVLFYAIFALGLNILVGYGGLVSLGHAGLFGITAYATAYLLSIGLGHITAILGALVISLGCTAVFAALALRATGIGFIMITLALGQIIWGLAYRWISLTGGDNGINVKTRPAPFGVDLGVELAAVAQASERVRDGKLLKLVLGLRAAADFAGEEQRSAEHEQDQRCHYRADPQRFPVPKPQDALDRLSDHDIIRSRAGAPDEKPGYCIDRALSGI